MKQFIYKGNRICQEYDTDFVTESLETLKTTNWDNLVAKETVLTAPCESFTDAGLELNIGDKKLLIPMTEISARFTADPTKRVEGINCVGHPTAFILCKDEQGEYYGSRIKAHKLVAEWLSTLQQGTHIRGRVTAFANYGAFIDVGFGYAAMLPISNISICRITHPDVVLTRGDVIDVILTKKEEKFTLSFKELLPTWEESIKDFHQGDTVIGIVRYKTEYGTFVALGLNLCGLTSDNDIDLKVGDKCSVTIRTIIPESSKIKLTVVNPNCGVATKLPIAYGDNINKDVITDWVFNKSDTRRTKSE